MREPRPGDERCTPQTAAASFFWVKMLIGVAATTLGATPLALRLLFSNFEDVKFFGSTILFGVGFLCILLLSLVRLAYTRDTNIECLIARASLAPGALNTIVFSVALFTTGEGQ